MIFPGRVPVFSEAASHFMSLFTTVTPVTIVFSYMEYKYPYGTLGKRRMGLEISYKTRSYGRSLVRNTLKFLPWHIGHTGVIKAMYHDCSTLWFMVGNIGVSLAVIYGFMQYKL